MSGCGGDCGGCDSGGGGGDCGGDDSGGGNFGWSFGDGGDGGGDHSSSCGCNPCSFLGQLCGEMCTDFTCDESENSFDAEWRRQRREGIPLGEWLPKVPTESAKDRVQSYLQQEKLQQAIQNKEKELNEAKADSTEVFVGYESTLPPTYENVPALCYDGVSQQSPYPQTQQPYPHPETQQPYPASNFMPTVPDKQPFQESHYANVPVKSTLNQNNPSTADAHSHPGQPVYAEYPGTLNSQVEMPHIGFEALQNHGAHKTPSAPIMDPSDSELPASNQGDSTSVYKRLGQAEIYETTGKDQPFVPQTSHGHGTNNDQNSQRPS